MEREEAAQQQEAARVEAAQEEAQAHTWWEQTFQCEQSPAVAVREMRLAHRRAYNRRQNVLKEGQYRCKNHQCARIVASNAAQCQTCKTPRDDTVAARTSTKNTLATLGF